MSDHSKYFLGTLSKTMALLELFRNHHEMGLTEMGQHLALSKSNVYRIVITLEHWGYLEKTKNLKYKLGTKLFYLGRLVLDRQELVPIARPLLKDLTGRIKESSYLAILTHDYSIMFLVKENSDHSIIAGARVGRKLPAYSTASGKALLAFGLPEFVEEYLSAVELKQKTEHTITSKEEFREALAGIRRNGYAIDAEETETGMIGIAAPVYNMRSRVEASISVAGPIFRMNKNLDFIRQELVLAAAEISRALGYHG
jgi:DNA-binding IclR family transcriptional regulator